MFVQVIQGQVADREAVDRLMTRWDEELRAGANGFLGATYGISGDGRFVNIARFDAEESARRNSDRPEQGAWWAEFSKCFSDEPTFAEGTDVELVQGGGRDGAGFVQVMTGRAKDRARSAAQEAEMMEKFSDMRPDYIGSVRLWQDGDRFVELAYFTSEEEARKGEKQEIPAEAQQFMADWQDSVEDLRYVDLSSPRTI